MSTKKIIQWKQGYAAKCNAQTAYNVLQDIKKRDGAVSATAVVEEARPKESPIHNAIFDRGQKAAAEQYYAENARKLVRSIETVVIRPSKPNEPARVINTFSAISPEGKKDQGRQRKVYQDTEEALKDPITRDEILSNAIRDALTFRRRYASLQEVAKIIAVMDDVLVKLKA